MANKNIDKEGEKYQFKKGNKMGKGRPRKLVSSVLEEIKASGVEAVTASQIKEVYEHIINLTQDELTAITNDKAQPMLLRIVAKNVLGGKGFEIIEKMLDRAQGKPTNKTEVTGKDGKDLLPPPIEIVKALNDKPIKPE